MSRFGCFVLLFGALARAAAAQSTPADDAGGGARFMPRYDFHLNAELLAYDDPRFVWDANFGGSLDIFSVGRTRLTFDGNYQAILGDQFRNFDPNQGNYILAGSLTTTMRGGFEAGPVFYHQSRHLSDRFKREPIDWNMLGGRVTHRVQRGSGTVETRLDLRRAVKVSFVDYVWELDTGARGAYRIRPHVSIVGGGFLRRLTVDGTRNRGAQTGGRVDGGVRFEGDRGALELFVAVERRIDPYQLEFGTARWTSVGMRLLSR